MASAVSLADRHALVTAAVGPLGRSVAVALAEAGATVSVTTLHDALAEEVRANSVLNECWSAGSQGRAMTLDLTDPAAVEAAVETLEQEVAPLDIVVHGARTATGGSLSESTLEAWRGVLEADVTSAFVVAQVVGRRMLARGAGRFITLVPDEEAAWTSGVVAAAAHGAVLGLTRALAEEWDAVTAAPYGLTANALALASAEEAPARALIALAWEAGASVQGQVVTASSVPAARE
ncbi:MAG: SDR family NAD(P)-dependent oxidoreductase [Dehalococcoidia bacterium]